MNEHALENAGGMDAYEDSPVADEAAASLLRPRFGDPESWHDLAERGTPRNGPRLRARRRSGRTAARRASPHARGRAD